jgi:hypothetical protein
LVRDPRDVVVSSYFQKNRRWKQWYDSDLSSYIYEERGSYDTILRYYNIWAKNRHIPKDFMLVRYEDLHASPHKELRRTLEFMGLSAISDGVISEVVKYASFDNMRKMEEKNTFKGGMLCLADRNDPESYKVRKGKVMGFAEYLNKDQIEYLNRKMTETLSDFYGYKP